MCKRTDRHTYTYRYHINFIIKTPTPIYACVGMLCRRYNNVKLYIVVFAPEPHLIIIHHHKQKKVIFAASAIFSFSVICRYNTYTNCYFLRRSHSFIYINKYKLYNLMCKYICLRVVGWGDSGYNGLLEENKV